MHHLTSLINSHFFKLTITLSLYLFSLSSWSTVYKWTDEQGNTVYSDQPRKGAEEIKIKTPNTTTLPKPTKQTETAKKKSQAKDATYSSLTIESPANNSAFRSSSGTLTVNLSLSPELSNSHTIKLLIDGSAIAETTSMTTTIPNIDRGTHQLQAKVVTQDGKTLISSSPVTFTIHRPSLLH